MNPTFYRVTQDDVEFADAWGHRFFAWLQVNEPELMMPGIITQPLLARSMIGEIAAAKFFGVEHWALVMRGDARVDQITEEQWGKLNGRQLAWDINVEGWEIDVKASPPPFVMLWPLSKIGKVWHDKKFDLMMSVSVDDDNRTRCWIDGFTTKDAFYRHKLIAGPDTHPGLIPGTWYMEKNKLHVITGDGPLLRRIALRNRMDELVKKTTAAGLARTGRMARYCKCGKPGLRFEDEAWWCADHKNMAGFVGYDTDGHFIHYCHCGKDAGHGFGVSLRAGVFGKWFCNEHKHEGATP